LFIFISLTPKYLYAVFMLISLCSITTVREPPHYAPAPLLPLWVPRAAESTAPDRNVAVGSHCE